ncbi:CPBP family intramembrane glutamic endopeptidase [Flagellimonas meishanensis]|uniref:CPBP family intramembrane glutamic endopeptidase n=1 Tax=Flagellimonas meishanensis TaxID=2873264 RepID=UPI001CA66712|nr:CPBP family intramembrane glutamic endopeptidase [[Muricauda] meishanensis]
MKHFRPFLKNRLEFGPSTGLFLILLFGIPRFVAVLHASSRGDYRFTSIIFVIMWILPFLLLTKSGKNEIGLKKPIGFVSMITGFVLGGLVCLGIWTLGQWFYGNTMQNWLVYISRSYQVPGSLDIETVRFQYFMLFAVVGMLFSPIGEEFLYRGLIHRCFTERFGENKASIIDSLAFGLTHLAHFGILFIDGHWIFVFAPALLWVVLMFITARVFFYVKLKTHSLWGAVVCHAGFNLAMTYFTFYHIF